MILLLAILLGCAVWALFIALRYSPPETFIFDRAAFEIKYKALKNPEVFIAGMSLNEFDKWLRTDRYGIMSHEYDKKILEKVHGVVSSVPGCEEHERHVIQLLITENKKALESL